MARSFIQEPNTAPTAPLSCSQGSSGNRLPVRSLTSALNLTTSSCRSATESLVSSISWSPWRSFFSPPITVSNGSWSSPAQLLDAEDDVAVHLDEPAVAVPREPLVPGPAGQGRDGLVVEAEVEDRVHHAGHRVPGAGADRDEQGVLEVAEAGAHLRLDRGHAGRDLGLEGRRIRAPVGVVVGADLGRDRESGGNRKPDPAHLGQIGALAAEQRLLGSVSVGLRSEPVDVFRRPGTGGLGRSRGCFLRFGGHKKDSRPAVPTASHGRADASME